MKTFYLEKSLGIDIREESIALALLGKKMRSTDLLGSHFFRIKPLVEGDEKAEKFFLEEFNRFLMQEDTWPENVVVSIPRGHYTLQTFELPAPDRKSLDSIVEFELERHFSQGLEGLYIDHHASPRSENQFHIIATAVKNETADRYLALLHKLNLKPTILESSTLANANLVLGENPADRSLSVIVNLGSHAIDITIIKNRIIEFSRNVVINDPEIRNAYFQENLPNGHYETLAISLTQILVDEIQSALASCRNINDSESVERIHLIGSGPFASVLARNLEKETDVLTTRVTTPNCVELVPGNFSPDTMATALSLGMRELKTSEIKINLLPDELKPKRKKPKIKTTLALVAATVLVLGGLFVSNMVYTDRTLASLEKQLEEIKSQVGTLEKIDLEYESLRQYTDKLNAIDGSYPAKLPFLMELSKILPRDTWLTRIKISKNEVEVKGYSAAASRLVPLVEQSPFFKETGFKGTILNEKSGEKFAIQSVLQVTQ